jgi:hypothetical protein
MIYEWVGRGTWQVVTQVLGVVWVELLSRWLLRVYKIVTYGRVSGSYRGAQRSNWKPKDPKALKNRPMT